MDEFMAIMVTNIYHSERGSSYRAHVRLLRRKQPELLML